MTAPTGAPTTPSIPAPTDGGPGAAFDLAQSDSFVQSLLPPEVTGLTPAAPTGADRDPITGQFVEKGAALRPPVDGVDTGIDRPIAEATAQAEAPAATPEPIGQPKADGKADTPATAFRVFDPQGELAVESVTPLEVEVTIDGKVERLPFEKVVHRAQQGIYDARQVSRLGEERKVVSERLTATEQQLQQLLQEREQIGRAQAHLFEDPDAYDRAREEYLAQNTPEVRAQREVERRVALEQQVARERASNDVRAFGEGFVAPLIAQVSQQYPDVPQDVLLNRFAALVPTFLDPKTGMVAPDRLPALAERLQADLPEYARGHQERIEQAVATRTKATDAERRKLQAQQRQVGRALTPVATGQAVPSQPTVPPITKASDALSDDYIRSLTASSLAAG